MLRDCTHGLSRLCLDVLRLKDSTASLVIARLFHRAGMCLAMFEEQVSVTGPSTCASPGPPPGSLTALLFVEHFANKEVDSRSDPLTITHTL